jgi:hypothetical protein
VTKSVHTHNGHLQLCKNRAPDLHVREAVAEGSALLSPEKERVGIGVDGVEVLLELIEERRVGWGLSVRRVTWSDRTRASR